MQLTDYSDLKTAPDEKLTIPLNGVNYHAIAEAPADIILSAAQASPGTDPDTLPDLPEGVTLEDLAEQRPDIAQKVEAAGAGNLIRMVKFFEDVLEPDSWERFVANWKAPAKGLSPAQRKQHLARMITFKQLNAVFRAMLKHYAGRPTGPSSSLPNGDGGTGGTSTETAPAEA